MNEEELQARLAQMQAQLQQATALGQQYGLTPQQASQQMQVYNQLANSGRFQGTLADYFAQRAQGPVSTPGIQWPAPSTPGLLDPPTSVGGSPPVTAPGGPTAPAGPGTSVGGEPRDPRIPSIPTLPPPTGGGSGIGGQPGGQLPTVQLPTGTGFNTDTLAAFGYMRGPNGEILPQMLQGGWSPYQAQGPMPSPQGFAAQPGNTLQLPQLGYDPNLQGFQWFTPPPASAPNPGAQPTTPTTPATPLNPLIPPPQTGGPPRGGQPVENQIQRLGLLGLAAQKSALPPALAGLLG